MHNKQAGYIKYKMLCIMDTCGLVVREAGIFAEHPDQGLSGVKTFN